MLDPGKLMSEKRYARTQEDHQDIPEIKFWQAFSIYGIIQFAVSFFFIKFAFYGVYYWLPSYLKESLFYTTTEAGNIMSMSAVGGIVGSILMGLTSDLLVVKSPVHTASSLIGASMLLCVMFVHTNTHTALLTMYMSFFFLFENGATIVIAIVIADIGKNELLKNKRRAVSTLSGINDGIAGFGSILGQLLLGPIDNIYGWSGVLSMFTGAALIACLPTIPYVCKEIKLYLRFREKERKKMFESTDPWTEYTENND